MKAKHFLAMTVVAGLTAASLPAVATSSHTLKLSASPAATVHVHCINSYLRRHQKAKIKFTQILNNWLVVTFKGEVSKSEATAIFDTAKDACGYVES